jgi:hypothetical protein
MMYSVRTKGTVVLCVAVLSLSLVGAVSAQEPVSDLGDLREVSENKTKEYVLTEDIEAGGAVVEPIGDAEDPFNGKLDGDGHTVTGLTVKDEGARYIGLFGVVGESGLVKQVGLKDVEASGGEYAGGIAGSSAGRIESSYVTGEVSGERGGGLITGWNDGEVRRTYAVGISEGNDAGVLVGRNTGTVTESYSVDESDGYGNRMGPVGRTVGSVSDVYTEGDVIESQLPERRGSVTVLSTEEMTGEVVVDTMQGFDFRADWNAQEGYPELGWENVQEEEVETQEGLPGMGAVVTILAVVTVGWLRAFRRG